MASYSRDGGRRRGLSGQPISVSKIDVHFDR